ncbi:MAG: type II secretion system F family protein [Bryobacteraceae bacterium]
MALFIAASAFVVLATIISFFGYRYYTRPGRVYEQLGGPAAVFTPIDNVDAKPDVIVTILEQLGTAIPVDPDEASTIRLDLIAAGYRTANAVPVYLGLRIVFAALVLIAGIVFRGYITSNPVLQIVIPIACGFAGWFGPSFILDLLVEARQERLRFGLPDALDLMVVCVEAGIGLDQAMRHVSQELRDVHPDIAEELNLVNLEIRGGKRRSDALHHMVERNGESELRKLVAVLIQTDRFGTSVAESLRTHADFMRVRRRQDAEERAGKVGVKLVFPIFFLILPSMLVVVAGPGLLQVFKYLFPVMRGFKV